MNYAVNKHVDKFVKGYLRTESNDVLYEDPTYIGFNFMITFDMKDSPLFYEGNDGSSAIKYLDAIGFPKKAAMLKEMKMRLKNLISNHPYYFQTLSGLKTIWNINMAEPLRTKEVEIEITTLETIDMQMTYIMDLYRKACYDIHPSAYRMLLPRNLRHFRMCIYISEMRKFHTLTNKGGGNKNPTNGGSIGNQNSTPNANSSGTRYHLKELKDLISVMAWDLYGCEFNFNDGANYLEELTNVGFPEMATNSFKFKPSWIREQSTFKLFNSYLDSYDNGSDVNNTETNFKTFEDEINPSNGNFDRFATREFNQTNIFEDNTENNSGQGFVDNSFGNSPLGNKLKNAAKSSGILDPLDALTGNLQNIVSSAIFGDTSLGNVYDDIPDINESELNTILGNAIGFIPEIPDTPDLGNIF